jgi:transcriptional regulator with XRE-family HTH domain
MARLDALEEKLLADAQAQTAFAAMADEYAIARALIEARTRAGLTQADVAQRMGTTQSAVARMESGRALPSLRTVERFAQAVGGKLRLRIEQGDMAKA